MQAQTTSSAPADSNSSASDEAADEFSLLIGNLVRNPHAVKDLDGAPASFFVFEDVSVRTQGRFTLEFQLGEA